LRQTLCEDPTLNAMLACKVILEYLISGLGTQNMSFYMPKLIIVLNYFYDKNVGIAMNVKNQ
jgi:hypothetical protein